MQCLGDLGLGHEGALALDPLQAPLDDQLLQRLAHGGARGVELGGQGALRGTGVPGGRVSVISSKWRLRR
ncbi:hypothetical protein SANT12839_062770 [Streptomyces antimycoticus]|uniref:Uncharacterized protein n=1 Tax=Streptomyces antimycoticus TaxID=68175 RepID=A0A4D4K8U9_9ACTN|nr:hypothetical protein SANT12839_062770 [Streptomyces antimycoticus]